MKSKEQFVERWKKHVAGMALFGVASEAKDGPIVRASKILDIPAEVERLLSQMWDDVADLPRPTVNGVAKTVATKN